MRGIEFGRGAFQEEDKHFRLDGIAVGIAIMNILIGIYLISFLLKDINLAIRGIFVVLTTTSGALIGVVFLSAQVRLFVTFREAIDRFRSAIMILAILAFIQIVVFAVGALSYVPAAFNQRLFYGSLGAGEEFLFRFGVLQWFSIMGMHNLTAILLCSGLFTSFHFVVYGAIPVALIIVFASSIVLSTATIITKNPTPAILGHFGVNFLAGG